MINTREIAMEYRMSHWSQIIQERNESGKSIKSYCESIGIKQNVYHYWQRKLWEAACEDLLPAVDVKKSANEVVSRGWATCEIEEATPKGSNFVIVEVGKFKLTIGNGDDMELFSKVCQTLVSLC